MDRRDFLNAAGMFAVTGLASCMPGGSSTTKNIQKMNSARHIPKVKVSKDRIVKETVGLRPFRPSGPRLDVEMLDKKTIVHNYGHGGSGWSLSWGTGSIARENALATGETRFAVLGCGVVGIATARLLQERGYAVTIYAKDLPPDVTSSRATGTWSPASRVCDPETITPEFRAVWEKACRFSHNKFQNLLGLGDIVSWVDEYSLRNELVMPVNPEDRLMIKGLVPERVMLTKKQHPFNFSHVSVMSNMMFNIPSYLNHHISQFLAFGEKIRIKEITCLEDIEALSEKCVVNCMGLGSKMIFNDEEITPVSGQLTCLIPQPEVNYKLTTPGGSIISRKDGIYLGGNGIVGNWDTTPSKEQTEKVIDVIQKVMFEMRS